MLIRLSTRILWQRLDCVKHSPKREKAVGEQAQGIITAMKGVYWLAKGEIATHKYSSLLELFEDVGVESVKKIKVGENATYRSHHTAEVMQQSIYTVLQKEMDTLVQGSPFVSDFVDWY